VSIIDKKLNSVCESLNNLDTTKEYHAQLNVQTYLVDTISQFELAKTNGLFIPTQDFIDSIKINAFDAFSEPQTFSITSRQNIFISKNKWIRKIDFDVTASLSPYYSNDTIFFNPYFNKIYIHKIYFKKCAFLTRLKPIVAILNSVFKNYLDNLNGAVKNYNIYINPLPADGIAISKILAKNQDVLIEKDDTLFWKKKDFSSSILIDEKGINCMLIDKEDEPCQNNFICSDFESLCISAKEQLFKTLYSNFVRKFNYVSTNSFDTINDSKLYLTKVKLSSKYLERNLNYAFSNLDFKFKYPIGYKKDDIYSDITIHKPQFDCGCKGFCDRLVGGWLPRKACRLACTGVGSITPVVGTFLAACETADLLWPDNYTIGSVSGNVNATGIVDGRLKQISFSNSLSKVSISKDLSVFGNLNYNFRFSALNKFSIGRLFFAIASGCVQLDLNGTPSVTGNILDDFEVSLVKQQDATNSSLQISIKPFTANVILSKSPGLEIVTNFSNYFTCGIVYKAVGISLVLGQIVPSSVIPDKFENYFNVATKGKYNHEFKIKSLTLPLDYQLISPIGPIKINTLWGDKSINATGQFPN